MSTERGMNIHDAVDDMKRAEHYRKNEEFRNMKFHQQQKKKKEADTAATVTTSQDLCPNKSLNNYTIESVGLSRKQSGELFLKPNGEMREHFGIKESQSDSTYSNQRSFDYAQDDSKGEVKTDVCKESDIPGDTPGREVRQQRRAELPVHLL